MMERLTIDEIIEHCKRKTGKYECLNGSNTLENADISLSFIKEYWEHRQVKEYLEELKRYRDLEEQGLLLRLPCKMGDTVYSLDRFCGGSLDCPSRPCKECPDYQLEIHEGKFALKDIPELGKTVFLTKSEAEQKLKEMENK